MPTKLPDCFTVSEQVRDWCLRKHGYRDLPDQFISDFRSHHAAKGSKYDDWDQAFKNWINWSSPSGKYYNAKIWENALEKCKRVMNAEKPKIEVPDKSFRPTTIPKDISELRRKLRAQLQAEAKETPKQEPDSLPDDIAAKQREQLMKKEITFSDLEDKELFA